MIVERLHIVECIPIKDFKHKIKTIKEYYGKANIEIINDKYIYIDRIEELKNN